MRNEIQEDLRRQLLDVNIALASMLKSKEFYNEAEHQKLKQQKAKILKALKKEYLADAQEIVSKAWLDISIEEPNEERMKL